MNDRGADRTRQELIAALGVNGFIAAAAFVALAAYVVLYARDNADAPIHSDGYSYYVYLPATLIYGDPSLEALSRDWYGGTYPEFSAIRRWPATGRWLNPHPIGTALLMTPFFVLGHALSWWSNLPRDGFSLYYQHAAGLAGLAYLIAGLTILRRILRRHFSDATVLATLISVTWGTNLFHYGVFDSTFSHAFSFFLICAWLWLIERWWMVPSTPSAIVLGAVAAFIVMTRHTNAIFLIVLPLYGVASWQDLRGRGAALWRRRADLAIVGLTAAIGLIPQFALYEWITAQWLVSPYSGLGVGFDFASPHLFGVLFSTQKGLFFWSPVLLLASVGIVVATGWARGLALPAAIVFVVDTFLVASWHDWQFGASFGHRAFTDGLGLAAPFLAACFAWAAERPRVFLFVSLFAAATVLLSAAQMIQYWMGILPIANTTWTQYRALFLRFP